MILAHALSPAAYARMRRDECMALARDAEVIVAPVLVRIARDWQHRMLQALKQERIMEPQALIRETVK